MSYNKEYYRKYREKNKEKIALKHKNWRKNNPEKEKARLQRQKDSGYSSRYQSWYRTTASCKYSSLRSRARLRKIKFEILKDAFIEWFGNQSLVCTYCKKTVTMGVGSNRKDWLTIDRKDNDGIYSIKNIVISCYRCNLIKSDDITYKEMIKIGKIIKK